MFVYSWMAVCESHSCVFLCTCVCVWCVCGVCRTFPPCSVKWLSWSSPWRTDAASTARPSSASSSGSPYLRLPSSLWATRVTLFGPVRSPPRVGHPLHTHSIHFVHTRTHTHTHPTHTHTTVQTLNDFLFDLNYVIRINIIFTVYSFMGRMFSWLLNGNGSK